MTSRRLAVASTLLTLLPGASALRAATPPCNPCAGLSLADPYAALDALTSPPRLHEEARLYVAWDVALDETATPAAAHALAGAGATPWMRLRFAAPPPLTGNGPALERELEVVAALAATRPTRAHYQVSWVPPGDGATPPSAREYAFLVKRAAVAISGVDPSARILAGPLPADPEWLEAFYGEEVAAYLDGIAFAPGEARLKGALAVVAEADPGSGALIDGAALPEPASLALAEAARASAAGIALTLFAAPTADAAIVEPLKLLADEFRGELALDPATAPAGAVEAWSFVRGSDLGLRVLAVAPAGSDELALRFSDSQLKEPARVLAAPREVVPLASARRSASGLSVPVASPRPVEVLRVERATIQELEGVAEEVTVATDRQIPVEEILRRLQAFEDGQARRLRHYQAINSTTLRFQAAAGVQAVEATFEGEVFVRQGEPFDWAWQSFYLNGVRWRGKTIPEIPLIQPEKAAAMPLEILFSKEYRYELAGTDRVAGRDCWVVDFEPVAPVEGRTLYRGRVWVDREIHARVRTRAIQLGLEGEVLSNEETMEYTPVDAEGAPAAWSPGAFVLPLRTLGQQLLSAFNSAVVVEKEVRLSSLRINGPAFDARREAVLASDATMVRDTDQGLRYLVPAEEGGARVVKEGYDSSKLFVLGGVFYDDSLDYPLPLAGVNYIDLEFRGPKRQLNAFFGGVLGIVNYADPRFLGTKLDLGVDLFGFAIKTSDQLYRDEVEQPGEEVRELPARVTFNLGYPLGSFFKLAADYQLAWTRYDTADDTDDAFVLPQDNLTQRLGLGLQFARAGYRLNLRGAWHQRSDWGPWGLPGNTEFDPEQEDYLTWEASASKNWYLSGFRKVGLELNWAGGEDLDRFSKYQFGFFGGNRVHGYQIGKVRAEEALAAHLSYGFEINNLLRLEAIGDAAWATDEVSGLDREVLAGIGVQGIFMGPWETLVSIDLGTPVAGPDDGISVYLVFLKLFD